jgi:hypothetical protein
MIIQAVAPLAIATGDLAAEPPVVPIAPHRGTAWDPQPARSRLRSNTRRRRFRDPRTAHRPPSPRAHPNSDLRHEQGQPDPRNQHSQVFRNASARSRETHFAMSSNGASEVRPPCAGGDAAGQSWAQRADTCDAVSANEVREGGAQTTRTAARSAVRKATHCTSLSDLRVRFSLGDGAALHPATVEIAP